jgi:hypothetical protein
MSTAAVSSPSIFQELQSFYQNRQADLNQLSSALHSGDLIGAQQAYKSLAVLGEGGPFPNSEPFGRSARAQAFDAVGEALQAGGPGTRAGIVRYADRGPKQDHNFRDPSCGREHRQHATGNDAPCLQ